MLGHNENKALFSVALLILQLVLMACVDPVLTELLGFDLALAQLHSFITAGYSREEDRDADKVGLILASLSCFDMLRAVNLYQKLHYIEGRRALRAKDMHPQSYRRLEALMQLAQIHEEERKTLVMFGKYRRDCVEQQASWYASLVRYLIPPPASQKES
jgi:predicted Zn-dependent protease